MKDGNIQSLGAVETKLMYTLHWILLDAAEECADNDFEKGLFHSSPFFYLFSIPTMTVSTVFKLVTVHSTLFTALCLSVCSNVSPFKGIRFSKFSLRERLENMAGYVGISTSRSFMLYFSLQTEAKISSRKEC